MGTLYIAPMTAHYFKAISTFKIVSDIGFSSAVKNKH